LHKDQLHEATQLAVKTLIRDTLSADFLVFRDTETFTFTSTICPVGEEPKAEEAVDTFNLGCLSGLEKLSPEELKEVNQLLLQIFQAGFEFHAKAAE